MSKSLLDTKKGICFRCGTYGPTEKHHIFGGPNRRLSEEDGLYVYLCHNCHNEPPDGVHFNKRNMQMLHAAGQMHWEMWKIIIYGITAEEARQKFMERYGKNYL